jgi:ubiquinone/menaquinone biosynthesis C-methylase UbiE
VSRAEIESRAGANPFADPAIAARYENWYLQEGRRAERLEKKLLFRLLAQLRGARSLVEVGCGTGHFTRWFQALGLWSVGLDLSLAMLLEARRRAPLPWLRGDAAHLPFADRSFDVVALVTTLEFLPDPRRALAEAWRVARRGILLGVLNRRSPPGRRLARQTGPIWGSARLFTVRELRRLVRQAAAGPIPRVEARTSLWPCWPGSLPLPWGGFIGLVAWRTDTAGRVVLPYAPSARPEGASNRNRRAHA